MSVALSSPPAPLGKKPWTILIYGAADNGLQKDLLQNLDDCEQVGSTDSVNIVSQLDLGGADGASRLYISRDDKPGLHSPVVEKLGPVNSADPKVLADFIEWGKQHYPAEHTMLIVSSHGFGWKGVVPDKSGHHQMTQAELESGLRQAREATGSKLDVLGFDACLMASAEVMHGVKDEASFAVASEEKENDLGWPYTHIVSPAFLRDLDLQIHSHRDGLSPREFATEVVKSAQATPGYVPTLAAFDMQRIPQVTKAVGDFSQALQASPTSTGDLRKLARKSESFWTWTHMHHYRDVGDFAQRLQDSPKVCDPSLKAAAQGVKDALEAAVVAEEHAPQYERTHGLTVELGSYLMRPGADYRALKFDQEAHWSGALDRLGSHWFWPWPI